MFVSEFRSPSHMSGLNRSASLSYTERVDSVSISGSNSQLNNSPSAQYIPDFNVRALTDLQFVKVTYTCTHQTHANVSSSVFDSLCSLLVTSGHSLAVSKRSPGVKAGQHAAVPREQPHASGPRTHPAANTPRHEESHLSAAGDQRERSR